MNCIFRSYPAHPWFSEWSFEPQGCGTSFREKNAGYFFQTLETVGQIRPNLENPEWSIQIPIPQNSRINILSNGFCGYLGHKKRTLSAEVIVPEPGILWGRFFNIPAPVLLSETDPENRDGFQWLESDTSPALLAIHEDLFCLITKARVFDDAVQLAENYLKKDFESALTNELERRTTATKLFEQMNHHDSLAVISAESMMHALRPPEGNIPGIWSQSPKSDSPHTNANELYALTLAWRQLDIATAEALVLTTLKTQGSSGAIPVICSPHQTFSILEAPKPLLVKSAEKVWEIRQNPKFLNALIPLLRRHLQWLLHHFDPKRRGLHCWQNSNEPLDPETYASELATADLSTLLLTEIEALNRLRKAMPKAANEPDWFKDEQAALELNLQTQFWNEEKGQFCNAIARSRVVEALGFPAFIPLLWEKLPLHRKNLVLEQIRESGKLPDGRSVLSWRKSALDDRFFPLFQQLLILETLKTAAPDGSLIHDFSQVSLKGLIEWHTLSLEEHNTLPIDPITAAYTINLQETHSYRYHGKGILSGWLFKFLRKTRTDWFEVAIVTSSLFAILCAHIVYKQLHRPPPITDLLMRMESAYANGNGVETLANSSMVIKYYPDQAAYARLLTGNLLLLAEDYEQAAKLFEDVRKEYPDSPAAMVSLGLAYQLQGNFEKAEANYAEFSYLFENVFPELVSTIQRYRYLMKEGFKKPPKWKKIYNYPDMHKL